jgi:hypothetical protein
MSAWLTHPVVQSAVVPLVVGFVWAWLLRPHSGILAGLGFAVAFGASVYLVMGFQWAPITSTRKIVMVGAGAVVMGLMVEIFLRHHRGRYLLLALGGVAAALWLIWPIVQRKEFSEVLMWFAGAVAYCAWLGAGMDALNSKPVNLIVATISLGIGTAVSALLGASALLGQLGGALAAVAGAYALAFVISGEFEPRAVFSYPAAVLGAMIGVAAAVYAKVPWTALAALAFIPALAQLPVPRNWGVLQRGLLVAFYTFPLAALAVILVWRVRGSLLY